jgi:hypothetical protein
LICRRIDDGTGFEKTGKDGSPYWIYRLKEDIYASELKRPDTHQAKEVIATPEALNAVYSSILEKLDLLLPHCENLQTRGFAKEVIDRNEYRSLTDQNRIRVGEAVGLELGDDVCALIPGLYRESGDARWTIAGPTGMLVPVRDAEGLIVALKVRRDGATDSKYMYLSSRRFGGPTSPAVTHVPIFHGSNYQTIRLTEGELKADFATSASGILTLGLPGVSGWQSAVAPLKHFGAECVRVAFDLDQEENRHVAYALENTVRGLLAEGFRVEVEQWQN